MINFISKRTLFVSISTILVVASLVMLFSWGLKLGIDFTGGSILEIRYTGNSVPSIDEAQTALKDLNLHSLTTQAADNKGMIFRFQETSEDIHQAIISRLTNLALSKGATKPGIDELEFEAVGPSVGKELQTKAIYAIIIVLITISLYIAWAFRKVSKPISSWKYGIATLLSLFHDVFIVLGFFAILGKFFNVEFNTSFVAAALTVLGFSVHDTIVVFDRIRENLPRSNQDFAGTVNSSLNQTVVRSINTSFTVLLVLLAITLLGGPSIQYFAMSLLVGIFFGTYSSIFLASPLLVIWNNMARKKNA